MIDFERTRPDEMKESFPVIFEDCRFTDVGTGWRPLIDDMCRVFSTMPAGSVAVVDLKEKWGFLHAWVISDGLTAEQETDVVLAKYLAEEKSRFVCEVCGADGFIRKPPDGRFAWLRCLCDEHSTEKMIATWMPVRHQARRHLLGVAYVYDAVLDRMRVHEDWRPRW